MDSAKALTIALFYVLAACTACSSTVVIDYGEIKPAEVCERLCEAQQSSCTPYASADDCKPNCREQIEESACPAELARLKACAARLDELAPGCPAEHHEAGCEDERAAWEACEKGGCDNG